MAWEGPVLGAGLRAVLWAINRYRRYRQGRRKVSVLVHHAFFMDDVGASPLTTPPDMVMVLNRSVPATGTGGVGVSGYYFMKVANLSADRDIEGVRDALPLYPRCSQPRRQTSMSAGRCSQAVQPAPVMMCAAAPQGARSLRCMPWVRPSMIVGRWRRIWPSRSGTAASPRYELRIPADSAEAFSPRLAHAWCGVRGPGPAVASTACVRWGTGGPAACPGRRLGPRQAGGAAWSRPG